MRLFGRKNRQSSEVDPVEEEPTPTLPPPPEPNNMGLRELNDHMTYLLSLIEPLPPFGMQLLEAWNQTLCEDLHAMAAVPPANLASIDGYAVRAIDIKGARRDAPVTLQLADLHATGLEANQAVPVVARTTLPAGADAVVPDRFGAESDGQVEISNYAEAGENVTFAGSAIAIGTPLMSSGDRLDERHIGLLAGAGIDKVFVRPRPRVVVISSGNDILEPGHPMNRGDQAWDANSYLIAAAAKAEGAQVWRVGIIGNDHERLRDTVTEQLIRADLVISTTGTQRDYEHMKAVLSDVALTDFTEVAMLPGKTQAFGLVGDDRVPMMLLPGNPVSAYVSFLAFVRPLLRKMMGFEDHRFEPVRAISATMLRSGLGQVHLVRGKVYREQGIRRVEAVHEPDALHELAKCNAIIVLDEETESVRAGETVMCWLLDDE